MTTRPPEVRVSERFFLDQHPELVALGLAWTGNPETARELAQEALVRAYRAWDRVAGLDIPGAWVRRMMINLLIDERRGERRTIAARHQLATPDHLVDHDRDDVDDHWWQAVRALPDRERAAITLQYLEDLSIADVARILEVALGTVKASLSHARRKLRVTLTEDTR